jgi:uncharacterized repeat protein (TIGR01451 family)
MQFLLQILYGILYVGCACRNLVFMKFFKYLKLWLWAILVYSTGVMAQVCAPTTSLVTTPVNGVVNTYYQGNGNLAVGASTLLLGAIGGGATTAFAVGDLMLVIQMQDASIVTANNNTYGNGSGSGAGSTSVGQTGLHEFVRVTGVGANISFTPALTNSYRQVAATATSAQKTYQVIRVPQYSTLTATGITAPRWNGQTGGVVTVDVQGALTLGSGTVEGITNRAFFVAGKGFRGGAGRQLTAGGSTSNDFATASTLNYHGSKAEGIAGTPYYAATLTSNWGVSPTLAIPATNTATIEGYPGGSYARGAPANAGGGGTDGTTAGTDNGENAGGGGGGNYGQGGNGGRPWNDALKDTGGRGGAGYAGTLAFNRLFMGGGGGAGGTNNGTADAATYTNQASSCALTLGGCSTGAPGGGIVIIRAKSVNGTGVIDARGAHGYNVLNDAGGGGGAAGSVIIQTVDGGNATVDATGGDGGNAWGGRVITAPATTLEPDRHGPGGAGGGGFVAFSPSTFSLAASVGGGSPGKSTVLAPEDNYGSTGFNGGVATFQTPNVPGVPQAALCNPDLSLSKTDGLSNLSSPGTNTYTLTLQNNGISSTNGTVTVADKLPAGLSVPIGPVATSGPNAANWVCSAATPTDIFCTSLSAISGSGGTSAFAISVNINATNGSSIINRAKVSGGGDPNKPLPADAATAVAAAALCTANNSPAGCALDTDTVQAPNLSLTKTDGTTTVVRGATSIYTLSVSNLGGTATTGITTVVDVLPTGLSFSGASPFIVNGFTCTVTAPNIVCQRATTIAAGSTIDITYTVLVSATAPSSVLNLAKVGGGGDPSPLKSTAPTTATTVACPAPVSPATTSSDTNTGCAADANQITYVNLTLTKDDGQAFASQSGSTEYVFTVQNIGTAASFGTISFRDVLTSTMVMPGALATAFTPAGTNGANWSCIRNSTTDISCTSTVSIPAGGSSSFNLTVNVGTAAAGTQIPNKARIGGGGDATPGKVVNPSAADVNACINDDNPLGCAVDVDTVQAAPEIRMSKSHPNPQAHNSGDTFAFTLVLFNNGGTAAATNTVRMVDVVPTGLTINSVAAAAPFTCATAGQVVTCNNTAATFPANTTRLVTITVTVAANATNELVNRAKISATGDPQNNVVATSTIAALCTALDVPSLGCAVDPVPLNADLRMDKQQRRGTAGVFQDLILGIPLGATMQYQLSVFNAGPGSVTGVVIADNVPSYLGTVTWACTPTGTATCSTASGSGNNISLTGTMAPLSTLTVLITGIANSATSVSGLTNTASVTAPAGIFDTNLANNTDSVPTAVAATVVSITKTNNTTTMVAGGTTAYTIVVTNSGPTSADGARLYDPVAAGLSCTAAPTCVAAGPNTTCPAGLTMANLQNSTAPRGVAIPTLDAGGSITVTIICGVTATGQ